LLLFKVIALKLTYTIKHRWQMVDEERNRQWIVCMVAVSDLTLLQCFDSVGWVSGRSWRWWCMFYYSFLNDCFY